MHPLPKPLSPVQLAALWSAALFAPDQVVELRAIGVTNRYGRPFISAGFFGPDGRVKMAEAALKLTETAQGVYATLNPLNPDLLARRCNRVARAEAGDLTKDKDIVRRRWLLVDADPVRASGISATDAEKAEARAVADAVREFLRGRGWPDPILTDSGNGFHLLYRVDLPAEDGGLVQRALAVLAARFDTDRAKIDRAVHNPSRICKVPFTWSRKGDPTADRPHRQARLIEVPPAGLIEEMTAEAMGGWAVQQVATELLDALADEGPATAAAAGPPSGPPPTPQPMRATRGSRRLLVGRWLADGGSGSGRSRNRTARAARCTRWTSARSTRPTARTRPSSRPPTASSGLTASTTGAPAAGGSNSRRRSARPNRTISTRRARPERRVRGPCSRPSGAGVAGRWRSPPRRGR